MASGEHEHLDLALESALVTETKLRRDADAAIQSSLDALTLRVAALEGSVPPPPPPDPDPQPPTGKTVDVSTDLTVAQWRTLAKDSSVSVIRFGPGTYRGGYQYGWRDGSGQLGVKRTATTKLTHWAAGAVVFDGAGAPASYYGDQAFYLGGCAFVDFDGSAGSFTFQNYLIGQTGIFLVTGSTDLTFRGIKAHDCAAGGTSNDQSSHAIYMGSGDARITCENWETWNLRKASVPNAIGGLNTFHIYAGGSSGAGAKNVVIKNAKVTDGNWAIVGRDGSTVTIDNLVATRCGNAVPAAIDLAGSSGSMKNSSTVASVGGKAIIWGQVTNAGGNGPFG